MLVVTPPFKSESKRVLFLVANQHLSVFQFLLVLVHLGCYFVDVEIVLGLVLRLEVHVVDKSIEVHSVVLVVHGGYLGLVQVSFGLELIVLLRFFRIRIVSTLIKIYNVFELM